MSKTVSINIPELRDFATVYGLFFACIEKREKEVGGNHTREAKLLLTNMLLLVSSLSDEAWNEATVHALMILDKRSFEGVTFPEWDPDEKESLDAYPLADCCIHVYATDTSAENEGTTPLDYYGPLFSNAGHVLDGVKAGMNPGKELEASLAYYEGVLKERLPGDAFLSALDSLESAWTGFSSPAK